MKDRPLDDITRLSPQERLSLISALWDSLTDADVPLTPAQEAELEHRMARFEADMLPVLLGRILPR